MAIKDRILGARDSIVEITGGVSHRQLEALRSEMKTAADARAKEAYSQGYNDGGEDEPPSGDIRRYGYQRSLTKGLRDFSRIDWERIIDIVWVLFQSNPVADRHFEMKRDYIIGGGVSPQTEDTELQEILDAFWKDNDLEVRAAEFTLQLFLFGCQCFPAFVRKADGRVRLGYIDPELIEDIIVHPDNAMEMWAVVVKEQQDLPVWSARKDKQVYRIVREDDGYVALLCPGCYAYNEKGAQKCEWCGSALLKSKNLRVVPARYPGKLVTHDQATLEPWERMMLGTFSLTQYTGSCFYDKVNSVSNQPRGYSDLLQEADWLDQHDETLFALADREQLAGYFSWHVKLTGADDAKVKERGQELRKNPPARGSVNVHNDAEEWTYNYPDLKQNASIETQNALLTNILGGLGWPRHFYGYGDETNRATAQAQHDPTWRSMQHDQGAVKRMLLKMLHFVRDQAELAGRWQPDQAELADGQPASSEIDIPMPEMTTKDVTSLSAALGSIVLALAQAMDMGLVTRQTAATAVAKVLAEMDIEINPQDELQAVDEEAERAGLKEEGTRSDWLNSHGELTAEEGDLSGLFAGVLGDDSSAAVR